MSETLSILPCSLAQPRFRIEVVKLYRTYYVKASYEVKPDVNWVNADPSQLSAQLCSVYCVNKGDPRLNFNTSINSEQLQRGFETFNCYCKRSYHLTNARRRVEYSFLLKKGLILLGGQVQAEDTCLVESRSLICIHRGNLGYGVEPILKLKPASRYFGRTSCIT